VLRVLTGLQDAVQDIADDARCQALNSGSHTPGDWGKQVRSKRTGDRLATFFCVLESFSVWIHRQHSADHAQYLSNLISLRSECNGRIWRIDVGMSSGILQATPQVSRGRPPPGSQNVEAAKQQLRGADSAAGHWNSLKET
jgi:hypothetical protein